VQRFHFQTGRTLLGQATFCSLKWPGLTRTSQVLPFGMPEINSDKPVYIADYCRKEYSGQWLNRSPPGQRRNKSVFLSWSLPKKIFRAMT